MWPAQRPYDPAGDIEGACVHILLASEPLMAFLPRVSTDQVGMNVLDARWVMVSREGGPQIWPLDYPRVDLNVYAPQRDVAFDMASIARAELHASPGYRGFGLLILSTQEEVGLVRSTDREGPLFRYFTSIRFTVRAKPDAWPDGDQEES